MKPAKELLKGSTTMLVLNLLNSEDMYGYQMIQELKKRSDQTFVLQEGTLYPILHNLENQNCILSFWKESDQGRKRKYYSITQDGKKLLSQQKKEWKVYADAVNKVIGGACFEG